MTTPTERVLYDLICDLVATHSPDPSDHHTVRSQAMARLRRARREGLEAYVAHAVVESVPARLDTASDVIPGIGVCRICDAGSVRTDEWGKLVDGEVCLGCGGPIYELLRHDPKPSAVSERKVPRFYPTEG